jgi:hypothetical protein
VFDEPLPAAVAEHAKVLATAGIFEMLRNFPTDGQFDVTVDGHVDDHWAALDRKRFIDLAEIVGPIDSETLGANADGQFFEIRLSNFRIVGREAFGTSSCRSCPTALSLNTKTVSGRLWLTAVWKSATFMMNEASAVT